MRGKKAKAIRRLIYGDTLSPRQRKYRWAGRAQIRVVGPRSDYQALKRLAAALPMRRICSLVRS